MKSLKDLLETEVTTKDIVRALAMPDSFALWSSHPRAKEMFKTWALGPVIEHRESPVVDQSNAKALLKLLEDPQFKDQFELTECSHWAVGWVKHLSYRAVEDDEVTPTPIAKVVHGFFQYLEEVYPIADEDDYSERQQEAEFKYFDEEWDYLRRQGKVKEDADGAAVLAAIHDTCSECHDSGDGVPYHTNEEILAQAKALGMVPEEEKE